MKKFVKPKSFLRAYAKSYQEIPGPKSLPLIGNLHQLLKQPYYEFSVNMQKKYGEIFKYDLFKQKNVYISDVEDIKYVFLKEQLHATRTIIKPWIDYRTKNNYSIGVANANGEEWKRLRSPLHKLLTPPVVSSYVDRVSKVANDMIQFIENNIQKDGQVQDLIKMTQLYGFEAFCSVLLGGSFGVIKGKNVPPEVYEFADGVKDMFFYSNKLIFKEPPLWMLGIETKTIKLHDKSWDTLMRIAPQLIAKRDEIKVEDGVKSFMDYVLENTQLTQHEKDVTLIELIAAGVDTTSNAFQWILYQVAKNSEMQELLYKDITAQCGKNPIKASDIQALPMLRDTVTEVLRISPVVPETTRILPYDIEIKGYTIPSGTQIHLNNIYTSMDEKNFKDPQSFCPHRHRSKEIHTHATFPFGSGSRMCPGKRIAEMELQVALGTLLQHYQLKYSGPTPKIDQNLLLKPEWTKDTILTFHKRE